LPVLQAGAGKLVKKRFVSPVRKPQGVMKTGKFWPVFY
jgi:hypothetical protein